ncbi:transmembrane protein 39A [Phymastichus coffea]|uniref:transmembrane protein 39A n=1 Tax=Phymastichus coffea TaxID=108790 RepID=UPI00273BB04D|nr:transmembrane protein 39A [Phymastichus coffea]XP_058806840.1 transmembrane protein 39A [Phymastichus coffea]
MAGGRRWTGGRNVTNTRLPVSNANNAVSTANSCPASQYSSIDEKKNLGDSLSYGRTPAPKHVPIPTIPTDGQLHFEVLSLCTCLVASSLQFLNLYRTVWWLPQSYNDYSMNSYLIDPFLIIFIITMASRQFFYALLCKYLEIIASPRLAPIAQRVTRIFLLIIIIFILVWCLYHMSERHNSIKVFYLCYPISVYFLMFGVHIGPFFDTSTAPLYIKEDRKTKFILDKPLHNCSLNAAAIRAEVASLKSDFNHRLKRALFTSSGNAYLCGVAPVIFVPQQLHFDLTWIVQHILMIWLGSVGTHFTQTFPVRYCDVLHRSALHLGKWTKVDNKYAHLSAQPWNDAVLWSHGSVVRYNNKVYRSEGLCTTAEPGNSSHYRFYILFGNPIVLQSSLLALVFGLVLSQLIILFRTTEWYKILSMSLLVVTNYNTLFRLTRDYFVCWKVYRAEQIIQEKAQVALSNSSQ